VVRFLGAQELVVLNRVKKHVAHILTKLGPPTGSRRPAAPASSACSADAARRLRRATTTALRSRSQPGCLLPWLVAAGRSQAEITASWASPAKPLPLACRLASGRAFYAASTLLYVPHSLSEPVGLALGAQAGQQRLREVATAAGFGRFRRVAETPFNLIYQARS
jgi:hypothetical protein